MIRLGGLIRGFCCKVRSKAKTLCQPASLYYSIRHFWPFYHRHFPLLYRLFQVTFTGIMDVSYLKLAHVDGSLCVIRLDVLQTLFELVH